MSSSTDKEIGAISQFLDLTVGQLHDYLLARGLSTVGSKLDLAARALIAQEQGIPPRSE